MSVQNIMIKKSDFLVFSLPNSAYSRMNSAWVTPCNSPHINMYNVVEYLYLILEVRLIST